MQAIKKVFWCEVWPEAAVHNYKSVMIKCFWLLSYPEKIFDISPILS